VVAVSNLAAGEDARTPRTPALRAGLIDLAAIAV